MMKIRQNTSRRNGYLLNVYEGLKESKHEYIHYDVLTPHIVALTMLYHLLIWALQQGGRGWGWG